MALSLGRYTKSVQERIRKRDDGRFAARLWEKDPTLWGIDPDGQRSEALPLGWLEVATRMQSEAWDLSLFTQELLDEGFTRIVHMGMGGSSMAPLMLSKILPNKEPNLELVVLDTSDPQAILAVEKESSLESTFFIEASKSGGTAETRAMGEYFYGRIKDSKGSDAGAHFAVISDQASLLHVLSEERNYRKQFVGFSDIGGRYSALSHFGLVPAALAGCNIAALLESADMMAGACGPDRPAAENPGVVLGAVLGELALQGLDKVTMFIPEDLSSLGLWLEQLIAESTGKDGKGIMPLTAEQASAPADYGTDRIFVYIRIKEDPDQDMEQRVNALRGAGRPVVTITLDDRHALGAEILRWEIATATAGAILEINPFDQPDVQASKDHTTRMLLDLSESGSLDEGSCSLSEGCLSLYGDPDGSTVAEALSSFLKQTAEKGYVAILAYVAENRSTAEALIRIRDLLFSRLKRAVTCAFGPRYLHSTGQLYKGGKNNGVFLILTAGDEGDTLIPTQIYTFGTLKRAQAIGDFEALRSGGRTVLRIDLGADVIEGLEELTGFLAG